MSALFLVPSSATALAPFSQNSANERCLSGSGQAHPGQSKPLKSLTLAKFLIEPKTPIFPKPYLVVEIIAGIPAAEFLGLLSLGALDSNGVKGVTSFFIISPIIKSIND